MLERELVEPDEAVPALADRVGVEVLVRRAVLEQVASDSPAPSVGSASSPTLAAVSASCTSGSARNAAARSASSRYMRMLAAADTQTPSMSSVRIGL